MQPAHGGPLLSSAELTIAVRPRPNGTLEMKLTPQVNVVQSRSPGRHNHVPVLDGLRGMAIVLVMFEHFHLPKVGHSSPDPHYLGFSSAGWIGVDLFFVLSGYLITGILLDTKLSPNYFRNFYARRALRIFPLAFGFLFFLFVVVAGVHPWLSEGYRQAVAHQWWFWCYLTNVYVAMNGSWSVAPGVGHFWSLAIEEQFYLIWPLVVFLSNPTQLRRFCLALILGALVLRIYLVVSGYNPIAVYVLTPTRMDSLAFGAILALVSRGKELSDVALKANRRILFLAAVALGCLCLWRHGWSEQDSVVQTIGYTIQGMFFASLLLHVQGAGSSGRIARFFGTATLRKIGHYSYAMYVLHPMVGGFLEPRLLRFATRAALPWHESQLLFLVLGIAATFAVAAISWYLLESRFLSLKRYFGPESRGRPFVLPSTD